MNKVQLLATMLPVVLGKMERLLDNVGLVSRKHAVARFKNCVFSVCVVDTHAQEILPVALGCRCRTHPRCFRCQVISGSVGGGGAGSGSLSSAMTASTS
jgi:hypothetical protein